MSEHDKTHPDHRDIGRDLDLFSFHEYAPGSVFWHPKGMVIFQELMSLIEENLKSGEFGEYGEVSTPILVKSDLWKISGHWDKFKENMFALKVDEQDYALKPMNCPETALIYAAKVRSYRDLPIRLAETTSKLHRNEVSGSLGGLLRVRQLSMDDAHIFCSMDQVEQEISYIIKLIEKVHSHFGFKFEYHLGTRPDNHIGSQKTWDEAEEFLAKALKANGIKFKVKEKDGAFYGPKLDINTKDSLGREWTVPTVQLDFNLPERFKLEYVGQDGSRIRPVMIHRAIYGTFERFVGVLLEHFKGVLPPWLHPVQAALLPVGETHYSYAKEVFDELKGKRIRVELFDSDETVSKRVREAELQKVPYILVLGDEEKKSGSVAVRRRGLKNQEKIGLAEFIKKIKEEIYQRKS